MDRLKTSPASGDDSLISAIRHGGTAGDAAIMQLYAMYRLDIYACIKTLITRQRGGKCDPEDIVHDAFIVVLHKIRHGPSPIVNLHGFWLGIAKKLWFNYNKKNRKIILVEDPEEIYGRHEESPEALFLEHEKFELIHACMDQCGNKCRDILIMWVNNYTMQEIADQVKLSSPAMARKMKYQCFKKLKELMEDGNILTPSGHIEKNKNTTIPD